jgi:hypothetical protein
MQQPAGHHLAELNVGRLLAPTDDPRVAEFMQALERVNTVGKRSPGFVWMMEGDAAQGNTATKINNDPQYVPNLTVWRDADSLQHFVHNTVHSAFFKRRAEWFSVLDRPHFVMWWVPIGHKPTLEQALERLAFLQANGDTDQAFGWSYLKAAQTGLSTPGAEVAAE